jgi:hypothetical protein
VGKERYILMKKTFIQYKNLGRQLKNNSFTIYSDRGFAMPSGLSSDELLNGIIVQIDDDASKVFVTPNAYDLIASGNGTPNLSGLKFNKVDDTPIFIPGSNNYDVTQVLTGSNLNNYRFGEDSMRISNNGNVIIVTKNSTFNVPNTGLFIFTGVSGQNWALRQTIPHPSGITNPAGYSSALTSNGSIIATSSCGINGSPGFIFVYTGNPTSGWNLFQTITGTSINSGFARNIVINEANPFSSGPSYLAATEDKKVSVYQYTVTGYRLYQTITHPDIISSNASIAMSDTIRTSQNIFASYIVIGTPSSSGALVYRQTFLTGWAFDQKLSGSQFDGSSVSINRNGDILVLGNRLGGSVGGYANIYTGRNILSPLRFKQQISGFGLQSEFANSVSIKDTTIVVGSPGDVNLGDNGIGRIFIYTGSKENGWTLSKSFTGTASPEINLGKNVDIYNETVIASAPKLSGFGAINIYNPTSLTNIETYISEKYQYAIWNNPVMKRWIISDLDSVGTNLTSPTNSFITNENDSIYGNYNGVSAWTGSVRIFTLNKDENSTGGGTNVGPYINKLHVYNTPGITGFAGTYTSGIFTIAGTPRVGFRNDQNPNFYIYKNSLPSAWRAVENLYNGPFTWYSATGRQGVDEDPGKLPPVTGWRLGDNSVMNPPPVTDAALPLPEMNFGHCAGNTLIYPVYVYQAFSSDPEINNLRFYSGGMLSSSGTSELFPDNIGLSDMFPDLYETYFDKKFFYTNIVNENRLFLFRAFRDDNYTDFYITRLPQNFNSGFYYWGSTINSFSNTGINTLQQARKVYKPLGNNLDNLKNISIDINRNYLNKFFDEEVNFNLNNLTGNEFLFITNNTLNNNNVLNVQGIYENKKIQSGQYSGLNCISGEKCIFANPEFRITGARCFDSGTNIWSILDTNFNFLRIQNCQTMPNILPTQYWFTGTWSSSPTRNFYNFGITNLYSHNVNAFIDPFSYMLYKNTGYNFNKVSGIFNLSSGGQFVFDLEDKEKITGRFGSTIGSYSTFGSLNNLPFYYRDNYYNTFQSGNISTVYISYASKRLSYKIFKSGANTTITKFFMPYISACCKNKTW